MVESFLESMTRLLILARLRSPTTAAPQLFGSLDPKKMLDIGKQAAFVGGKSKMILIATVTTAFITSSGRSARFVGVLVLMVYLVFAITVYLLPPEMQ